MKSVYDFIWSPSLCGLRCAADHDVDSNINTKCWLWSSLVEAQLMLCGFVTNGVDALTTKCWLWLSLVEAQLRLCGFVTNGSGDELSTIKCWLWLSLVEAQLQLCGFVTNGTNLNEDISLRSYEVLIDIIEAEIQSAQGVTMLCTSIFLPEGVFFYEAGSCLVTSLPSIFICLKSSTVNLVIVFT